MKRKKKESTPQGTSKSREHEERTCHSEQGRSMEPQRARTVSKEGTPHTLIQKESDITNIPRTRSNNTSQSPHRKGAGSMKIFTNPKESTDSPPGINFRSKRHIANMSSPSSVAVQSDMNKNLESVRRSSNKEQHSPTDVSPKNPSIKEKLSQEFTISSEHSPGRTMNSRRRINYSSSPKHKEPGGTITANNSPINRNTRTPTQDSPQKFKSSGKILTPKTISLCMGLRSRAPQMSPEVVRSNVDSSDSNIEPINVDEKANTSNKTCTQFRSKNFKIHKDSPGRVSVRLKSEHHNFYSESPKLNVNFEELGTEGPSILPNLSIKDTPSKSDEKTRKRLTSDHPRSSPVTRSCSKNSPISIKNIPDRGQGLLNTEVNGVHGESKRTPKGYSNCQNINISSQNTTNEKKVKRKLQNEEQIFRRKKLRSEVKGEELWEGFLPIRFKRLIPKKNVSENKVCSTEENDRDIERQGNHSKAASGNKRSSFADLYDEFLLKSNCVSPDQRGKIKNNTNRSMSDIKLKCCVSKSGLTSSNSVSNIVKFCVKKNEPNLQEILSKLKREYEAENNKDNLQDNKIHVSPLTDKNKGKRDEGKSDLLINDKPNNSSVFTPKRSARLQEKKSLVKKSIALSNRAVQSTDQEPLSFKKKSVRSLFSESAQFNDESSTDNMTKESVDDKDPNLNEPSKKSLRSSRIADHEEDFANEQSTRHSWSVGNKTQLAEQSQDKKHQINVDTSKHISNKVSETNQVPARIGTRRTPNRGVTRRVFPCEQKPVQDTVRQTDEICRSNEQCETSPIETTKKKVSVAKAQKRQNSDSKSDSPQRLSEAVSLLKNNVGIKADTQQQSIENQSRILQKGVPSHGFNGEMRAVKKQMINSDHIMEFSNNALRNVTQTHVSDDRQNGLDIIQTSSQNVQQHQTEKHNSQNEQHLSSCRLDLSSLSNVDKVVDDVDNEHVIMNMLRTIVTQIEESDTLKEISKTDIKTDIAKTESLEVCSNPRLSEKLQYDNNKCLIPNATPPHNGGIPKQQSGSQNDFTSNTCSQEEGSLKCHQPLKIVVRKTYQGAQIVKKSDQLSGLSIQSTSKATEDGTSNDSQKQCQGLDLKKKLLTCSQKQTRSKTRSGEGEMARIMDNPDTELRPPRHKGKYQPRQAKGGSSKQKSNAHSSLMTSTVSKSLPEDFDLLQNQTIGKHACLLWSSENRRHFHLTCRGQDSAGIEEVMRKAWEALGTKERLKYYQRANSATKDENRHSTPRKKATKDHMEKDYDSMKYFLRLPQHEQYNRLSFCMEKISKVSNEAYVKMIEEFKIELQKAREKKSTKPDMQAEYRKALYQNILDVWETVHEIEQEKLQQEIIVIREDLSEITRKLIFGEGVSFSKTTRSEKLAELLLDLHDLETENKVSVNGEPLVCREYNCILDDLLECEFEFDDRPILADIPQASSELSTEIFYKALNEKIPELDASYTEKYLNPLDTNAAMVEMCKDRLEHLAEEFDRRTLQAFTDQQNLASECCDMNSPSCYLNNWLVADELRGLSEGRVNDEQRLIDPKRMAPVLRPLKRKMTEEKFLSTYQQIIKDMDTNNNASNSFVLPVPQMYKSPYDLVTFSRSANVISSTVNRGVSIFSPQQEQQQSLKKTHINY